MINHARQQSAQRRIHRHGRRARRKILRRGLRAVAGTDSVLVIHRRGVLIRNHRAAESRTRRRDVRRGDGLRGGLLMHAEHGRGVHAVEITVAARDETIAVWIQRRAADVRRAAVIADAKGVKALEDARGTDAEHRAEIVEAACVRGAVEITIGALHQRALRIRARCRARRASELHQRGQHTGGGHFENRADASSATCARRAVEIAIAALDQIRRRRGAEKRAACAGETQQRGEAAVRRDLEDRAEAARAAAGRSAVKGVVTRTDQIGAGRRPWHCSRRAGERGQRRERASGSDLEHGAKSARAAALRRAIEIPVHTLHHASLRRATERRASRARERGE